MLEKYGGRFSNHLVKHIVLVMVYLRKGQHAFRLYVVIQKRFKRDFERCGSRQASSCDGRLVVDFPCDSIQTCSFLYVMFQMLLYFISYIDTMKNIKKGLKRKVLGFQDKDITMRYICRIFKSFLEMRWYMFILCSIIICLYLTENLSYLRVMVKFLQTRV